MAPKQRLNQTSPAAFPATAAAPSNTITSASSQPLKSSSTTSANQATAKSSSASSSSTSQSTSPQAIVTNLWNNYVDKTPQRVKLIDVFMAFLVVLGAIQFVYCVVAGNYPFNAFLSGFSATVGQFVLTASLRIQTNPENKADFESVSNERAFADYIFGSLLLHFFCVNFIN